MRMKKLGLLLGTDTKIRNLRVKTSKLIVKKNWYLEKRKRTKELNNRHILVFK